jgi:hypothetical protein
MEDVLAMTRDRRIALTSLTAGLLGLLNFVLYTAGVTAEKPAAILAILLGSVSLAAYIAWNRTE